ncbi:MAG: hypothetical protein IT284_01950 [Bacteroidetes bacterium]|nr:hypothetical protein [Bacteroidota bacterium]
MPTSTIAPKGMFRLIRKEVVGDGTYHVGDYDRSIAISKANLHNNAREGHEDDFLVVFNDEGIRVHGPQHEYK